MKLAAVIAIRIVSKWMREESRSPDAVLCACNAFCRLLVLLFQSTPPFLNIRPQPINLIIGLYQALTRIVNFGLDLIEKFVKLIRQNPLQRQRDEPLLESA